MPGGYVYITRQLMGLMDDEFQLAFALGHEVGHIAANHAQSASDMRSAIRSASSGRSSARSSVGGFGNVSRKARARSSTTLSFSREQEYQADTLGLRYLSPRATIRRAAPESLLR